MAFTFVEHPAFTRKIQELLEPEKYRQFQWHLVTSPEAGDVIPGLNGLRKVRWGAKGKGKRGGARMIYLLIPQQRIIYLFSVYTKGDLTDMTSDQKKRLAALVQEIKNYYQQ